MYKLIFYRILKMYNQLRKHFKHHLMAAQTEQDYSLQIEGTLETNPMCISVWLVPKPPKSGDGRSCACQLTIRGSP